MKYHVNDACVGCGLCTETCPEVFSMGEAGFAVAIREEAPADALERAAAAADDCPVGAIEKE